MNRQLLFSAAFCLAGMGAASANDDLPATYDTGWTGLYGTLSAGYTEVTTDGSQTFFFPGPETESDSDTSSGGIFGLGFGYNHDFGSLVLGVEGDISMMHVDDGELDMKNTVEVDYDWFATARARAGIDLDGTLIYATGGYAALDVGFSDFGTSKDITLSGWTAGGGIEHMMSENWSIRLEALYADFGSKDFKLSPDAGFDGDTETETDMFLIRAGISLRL